MNFTTETLTTDLSISTSKAVKYLKVEKTCDNFNLINRNCSQIINAIKNVK